jgi:hypothetical protein
MAVILALAVKDVVRVAVNEAYGYEIAELLKPLAGAYVRVHGEPHEEPVIGTFEFRNCTAPVGAKPALVVPTVAVRVMDWPGVAVELLATRVSVVGA